MTNNTEGIKEMSAEDQFTAIENIKVRMENDFVSLGQLLSMIKRTKAFKLKHYKTFKEFVEDEFNMSGSFAAKLINTYELYIEELEIDELSVKTIGFDKLNMIKSFVKDAGYEETESWINKAQEMNTADLREEIKELREIEKENKKSMKDILIEQYRERMATYFNCGQKEMNFKLALYFQDMDLEEVKKSVKIQQRRFEENQQRMEGDQ